MVGIDCYETQFHHVNRHPTVDISKPSCWGVTVTFDGKVVALDTRNDGDGFRHVLSSL